MGRGLPWGVVAMAVILIVAVYSCSAWPKDRPRPDVVYVPQEVYVVPLVPRVPRIGGEPVFVPIISKESYGDEQELRGVGPLQPALPKGAEDTD